MTALLKPSPQAVSPKAQAGRPGVWQHQITGRFRPITTHQLALAWWLYEAGHINRRQLRVYFAAHEMHERRRYTKPEPGSRKPRKPLYGLEEIKALVGGRGTATADRDLSADIKRLGRLGLVKISAHAIEFAVSADQINVEDLTGFWAFFEQLPNTRRTVPVPRRTVRALAAGFTKAMMGTMIALMIRSLFWHKREGGYRVDGRTKGSWIAEVFGLGRRSVTDARARLIELGWLRELESEQWQLNRYGTHDAINVEAFGPVKAGESASPTPDKSAKSASPCLNSSSSSSMNLNTRKPAPVGAGTAGGSRKRKSEPCLRSIVAEDLSDTGRLLELHRQAIAAGHPVNGEAGRLDFIALAERARSIGNNPPRLFAWLLKHRRFDFIAIANEEAAARRLREIHNGPRQQGRGDEPTARTSKPKPVELTDDDKVVLACIQTAQKHHGVQAFTLARQVKGWTRDQWDAAFAAYQARDRSRWG